MVKEHSREYIRSGRRRSSIAGRFGMHPVMLHESVKRAEVDSGQRVRPDHEWRERLKQLERENRELRGANEILKGLSFFGTELGGRGPR